MGINRRPAGLTTSDGSSVAAKLGDILMRSLMAHSLLWGACLAAGVVASAKPGAAANCVLYARGVTGIALFGDAGGWWDQARGQYERGQVPAVGSILVFKHTRRIPSGHVAVVAQPWT